ncbi:SUMO-targeted ubiquitin ligase complex subunit slx8 [Agyrium rufum]|nr:SUMO-targeted ubiquitin ligase complex subunit slx8 [Agyrium rufum]
MASSFPPHPLNSLPGPVEAGSHFWDQLSPPTMDAPDPRSRFGFVDLTVDSPPASRRSSSSARRPSHNTSQTARRPQPNPGFRTQDWVNDSRESSVDPRPAKRRRGSAEVISLPPDENVEEVDLRDVDDEGDIAKLLQKQREEAIQVSREEGQKATLLSRLSCVICMEDMTDITATSCGHLFCHTCLMEALIAGETQGQDGTRSSARCPICRKKVAREKGQKTKYNIVPLELMVRPKSQTSSSKGKEPLR